MAIKIEGSKELLRKLHRLKPSKARRIVRSAMTKANRVTLRHLKASTPRATRVRGVKQVRLYMSMAAKVVTPRRGSAAIGIVGQDLSKAAKSNRDAAKAGAVPQHLIDANIKPHAIAAKTSSILRWRTNRTGRALYAYAKQVKHPGRTGDAFINQAARESLPESERVLVNHAEYRIDQELMRG